MMKHVESKAKRARAARKLFAGGVQAVAAFGAEVATLTDQPMTAVAKAQLQASVILVRPPLKTYVRTVKQNCSKRVPPKTF